MFRRRYYSLALLTAAVALGGCGKREEWTADRPKPFPAGGTVLYNQKPLEGATVVLVPDGHKRAATAVTDAEGKFQLQTYRPRDGAVPGKYKVTIRKVEATSTGDKDESNVNAAAQEERWLIPKRYGVAQTSGLKADVIEGENNDFTFELRD